MNLLSIPPHFNSYQDLSFSQVRHLYRCAKNRNLLRRELTGASLRSTEAAHRCFTQIRDSVSDANLRLRSWCQFFGDILTLNFIKIAFLRHYLPTLIAGLNSHIRDIRAQQPVQPVPIPSYSNLSNSRIPGRVNEAAQTALPNRLSPPARNDISEQIEYKLDIYLRAYTHFTATRDKEQAIKGDNPHWVSTAIQVDEFFQDRIRRLNANENVALPIWYHASKSEDSIAEQALLIPGRQGAQGPGIYMSTRDEHYNSYRGYGDYTFALDDSLVNQRSVTFQTSHYARQLKTIEEKGLWICVREGALNLEADKVAYIIVPDADDRDKKVEKFWLQYNFFVEEISRPAADWIRKSITAVHTHILPRHWKGWQGQKGTDLKHVVAHHAA